MMNVAIVTISMKSQLASMPSIQERFATYNGNEKRPLSWIVPC